jgi:non-heme chloroperoxidase
MMPFIAAKDGAQLYWREWGAGAPMLFLNSLGCGAEMWDYQMTAFAEEGFRCIGFDRRGHGRSDQPARGYDFDTFADDVAVLIDPLELSDLTLIAHSIAGGEAARYLTRHGKDRVARLILLAPTTPMLLRTEDNPNGALESEFEALWAQWKRDYPKWIADNVAPFFIPETSPAMMRWGANLLQTPVPIALACARAMVEEDFRARCGESMFQPSSSTATATARRRSSSLENPPPSSFPAAGFSSMRGRRTDSCSPIWTSCTPTFCGSCARPGAQRAWPKRHREFMTGLWSTSLDEAGSRVPLFWHYEIRASVGR